MATLAEEIAASMPKPIGGPTFQEALPFYQAWGKYQPMARQVAATTVNPEAMRQFEQAKREYMLGMANSGSGRFGRSWSNLGSMEAEAERNRQAQIADMENLYKQGFTDLVYNPAQEVWTKSMTLGQTPTMPTLPDWQKLASQYSGAGYGNIGTSAGEAALISPFLGRGQGKMNMTPRGSSGLLGREGLRYYIPKPVI